MMVQARSAKEEQRLIYFQGFFFYPPFLFILIVYAASGMVGWWKALTVSLVCGPIIWMFIEYAMHRAIFHRPERGKWWTFLPWVHGMHHERPRDVRLILAPVWFSLPISGLIWVLLTLLLGKWQTAIFLMSGIWIGYLWYEFVHYSAHCRRPTTWLMRYLKTYHLLHHHTSDFVWFGVTSPIIDHLFGTYRMLPQSRKQ